MKRRLLLVEDDEVFLRPLHRTLELKGYEVVPVHSAEEALDSLKAEDVDVVLTDRRLRKAADPAAEQLQGDRRHRGEPGGDRYGVGDDDEFAVGG